MATFAYEWDMAINEFLGQMLAEGPRDLTVPEGSSYWVDELPVSDARVFSVGTYLPYRGGELCVSFTLVIGVRMSLVGSERSVLPQPRCRGRELRWVRRDAEGRFLGESAWDWDARAWHPDGARVA